MRSIAYIVPVIVIGITLAGCSGSKSYAKKAGKLDGSGLYAEAADMYLQAVQRNQKNVDANQRLMLKPQ